MRLSAEAFSYLTLRGIAGEPLKVVLLADRVDPREGDGGRRARAPRLPRRDHDHRRHRLARRDGRPAADADLVPRVPRVRDRRGGPHRARRSIVIAGTGDYLRSLLRAHRSRVRQLARGRPRCPLRHRRRAADARSRARQPAAARRAADRDDGVVRADGARGLGHPARGGRRRSRRTRRSRSRRSRGSRASRPRSSRRTSGALEASSLAAVAAVGAAGGGAALGARAPAARAVLGRPRSGDLPARRAPGGARGRRRRADATEPHPRATLLYLPFDRARAGRPRAPARRSPDRGARRPLGAPRRLRPHRRLAAARAARDIASRYARRLAAAGGDIVIATTPAEWEAAIRGAETIVADDRRSARAPSCPRRCSRPHAIGAAAPGEIRDVPAGADWPESGVLRVAAADAHDVRRLARGARAAAPARAAAAVGSGRLGRAGDAGAADRASRPICRPPRRRSGARATRTPTRPSRASTAASRCRSASR